MSEQRTSATSFSVEPQVELPDQSILEIIPTSSPLFTAKIRNENGCARCEYFEKNASKKKRRRADDFYCDVGIKAVLRAMRRLILKKLRMPVSQIYANPAKFEEASILFFQTEVLATESPVVDEVLASQIMSIVRMCLDLDPNVQGKTKRRLSSTYQHFNRKLMIALQQNPLFPEFSAYMKNFHNEI